MADDIGTRNRKKPERYEAANEEAKKKRGRPLGSKGKGVGKTTKGEKGKKKGKKVKDPNAPKRALSAYMHFAQENRAKVKEDNPNATFGQLGKLLGEQWQNASAAEKKKYNALAEKDKARYQKDMEKYKGKTSDAEADDDDEE